jgi:hypothetical protein
MTDLIDKFYAYDAKLSEAGEDRGKVSSVTSSNFGFFPGF